MTRTSFRDRAGTRPDSFRRTFIATIVVLALLCAGFVTLDLVTGPKLSRVQVDTAQVVQQSNQQLRFFSTEQLGAVSSAQLVIEPSVDTSLSVSGQVLAVQFARPLDYDTDYTVSVSGVTNTSDDQAATFTSSFHTADPPLYLLHRSSEGDSILRASIGSSGRETVFTAEGIEDYVQVGGALAVTRANGDGTSSLSLVALDDGTVEQLPLPIPGVVSQLSATPTGSMIGFALTSANDDYDPEHNNVLYTLDLAGGRTFASVPALDGKSLEVQGWAFVPGTTKLVAQDLDSDVAQFDLNDPSAIVPLGHYADFAGLSTDGTEMAVRDQLGPVRVSLSRAADDDITPSIVDGAIPRGGDVALLSDGYRAQVVEVYDDAAHKFAAYVVLDDGVTARKIYQTVRQEGRIVAMTPSPNDQYLAIEVEPNVANSVTDGYAQNPRSTTITTVIVDMSSGAVVRSLEGFAIDW
jgi:hypothetical protein